MKPESELRLAGLVVCLVLACAGCRETPTPQSQPQPPAEPAATAPEPRPLLGQAEPEAVETESAEAQTVESEALPPTCLPPTEPNCGLTGECPEGYKCSRWSETMYCCKTSPINQ